jgi:flagellin-like hook-associated protein FlgL
MCVLQEIHGLFVEGAGNTNSGADPTAIQLEVDSSLNAIERLGEAAGFALPNTLNSLRAGVPQA